MEVMVDFYLVLLVFLISLIFPIFPSFYQPTLATRALISAPAI